jgi:hypothetical protein
MKYVQESLTAARKTADRWEMANSLEMLGVVHLAQGSAPEAEAALRQAKDEYRDLQMALGVANCDVLLAEARLALGDAAEAVDLAQQGLESHAGRQERLGVATAEVALAGAYLEVGRIEEARVTALSGITHAMWIDAPLPALGALVVGASTAAALKKHNISLTIASACRVELEQRRMHLRSQLAAQLERCTALSIEALPAADVRKMQSRGRRLGLAGAAELLAELSREVPQ